MPNKNAFLQDWVNHKWTVVERLISALEPIPSREPARDNSGKANSLLDIFGETAPSNSPAMQAKSSNSFNNSSNAVASKVSNHGDNEIGQMLEQMGNTWNDSAGDTKTFPVKVAPSLNQGSVALKSNPLAHHSINAENTVASPRSLWMDKPNEYLNSSSVIELVLLSPKLDSSSHQSQPWTSTLHRTDHSSSNRLCQPHLSQNHLYFNIN